MLTGILVIFVVLTVLKLVKTFFGNDDMEAGALGADPSMSNQTKCLTFKPGKDKQ